MEIWEASATLAFIPIMILTRFVMIIGMMENTMVIVFFLSWYWYVRCADPDDGGCRDGEYHDDIIIVIVIILKIVIAILIVNITPESYSWWSCPAITIIILSVMAEMLIVDLGCKILETEINLTSTVLWLKKAGLLGLDVFPRLRCHCYYYLSLIIIIIRIIFQ